MTMSESKVYLVTQGDYSAYHVVAGFSRETDAEAYVDLMKRSGASTEWYEAKVEVFSLDPAHAQQALATGRRIWFCSDKPAGDVSCKVDYAFWDGDAESSHLGKVHIQKGSGYCSVLVEASDEESAVKIAAELIAQAEAEAYGIVA